MSSSHTPVDIELEILKRLPIKSLVRFTSVCKAWKSLISCSQFICGYSVPQTQPQHLLYWYTVGDWKKPEVKHVCFVDDDTFPQKKSALTVPQGTALLGSSHGLLCMLDTSKTQTAVIWNPAIRKSIAVAVPNPVHHHQSFHYIIGFGVCPYTKDPKLVKITYIVNSRLYGIPPKTISHIPCQVMVFTLSSGEWRCLRNNHLPRKSIDFDGCRKVLVGQFIYFHASDRDGKGEEFNNQIMSFDLSTDEFAEVDIPERLTEAHISISRLRESLVLLEYDIKFPSDKQFCTVWMMEHGDRKSFTKVFTIEPPNASVEMTLGFRRNGEPIIEMLDHPYKMGGLVVYEPCLGHVKHLGIRGIGYSPLVHSYTESLLLLDHDEGHIVRHGASCEEVTFGTIKKLRYI